MSEQFIIQKLTDCELRFETSDIDFNNCGALENILFFT